LEEIYQATMAPSRLKTIAGLRLSALYLGENNKESIKKAVEIYKNIANCGSCQSYGRDLARLLLVKFWLINEEFYNNKEIIKEIDDLAKKSEIFKYDIILEQAFFLLSQNNLEDSYNKFQSVVTSLEASDENKETAQNGINILFSKGFKLESKANEKK